MPVPFPAPPAGRRRLRRFAPTALLIALMGIACGGTAPIAGHVGNAPAQDYWSAGPLRYTDHVYSPTVRTVQLFKEGFELAPPVIELGSTDALVLRFDDLAPDPDYLSYSIVHCDAHWNPSDVMPGQYMEGPPADFVPAARQSFNTLLPFLQYELRIPNDMVRPTRSGNYLLKVFRDQDPEDLVLTRRFMVFEQAVDIDARVVASRQVDVRDIAQQVDLTVRHARLPVQDPFAEVHVAMLQNMRWDDLRTGFKPRFMRGTELIYDFPEQGLFMGGNEFRNFDLKDLRFASQRVARIEQPARGEITHAWLTAEEKRNIRVYFDQPDINGRFFVRNDFFDGDPLGADYVTVHFTLPMPAPLMHDVHVYGAFTDWRCTKENRMTWDPARSAYTASITVKQGFYDFAFVAMPHNASVPDIGAVEGDHFQTENDYLVMVYFTDRMQRLDRLVGVRFLNSRRG
ncbi:MAG: DUF5103 domain-containing protein [Flavobacteriales bacterium]|jgi:hypothetical protein|nr:DUF5103 domain-containing protein [Flavobacteriales bacterium]